MSGSSNIPFLGSPQGYSLTVPGPIDDRFVVSEVANLSTEIVDGVRFPGLMAWVENVDINGDGNLDDAGEYYFFNNGIEDADFIALRSFIASQGGVNTSISFVYSSSLSADIEQSLAHNLSSNNLIVQFYDGTTPIAITWKIPEFDPLKPLDQTNSITFTPNIELSNCRVVITFVNTLFLDPPAIVDGNGATLVTSKLTNVTDDTILAISANTKLESIDYQATSTPAVIRCGTTAGGNEIHEDHTVVDVTSELISSIFTSAETLYFTVTSGIFNININVRQNIF